MEHTFLYTSSLYVVLITLLGLRWSAAQLGYHETRIANKCFSVAGVPRLDFDACYDEEMLLIVDAIQGIGSEANQCEYRHGDCIEPTTAETDNKLREKCIGRPACSITVSVAWMPQCSAYSSYNYVMYQCIQRPEIVNICEHVETLGYRMAHIQSPGYPVEYGSDLKCRCNISTDLDQRILLKFADYSVEWSENCDKDVVQVSDGTSRMPRCGPLPRNYNITSRTNKVQVYFRTDQWNHAKGFWLIVESLGSIQISCGPSIYEDTDLQFPTAPLATTMATRPFPTTKSTTRAPTLLPSTVKSTTQYREPEDPFINEVDRSGPEDNQTEDLTKDRDEQEGENSSKTVGIIVGCILAAILLVVLIILIVWFKKRRHKEDISAAPEPTYRSSTSQSVCNDPQTSQEAEGASSSPTSQI